MTVRALFDWPQVYERREILFLSQICHLVASRLAEPRMQLENGILVISVDVDVGSRELGVINRGKNDENISRRISEYHVGKIEEAALPLFVENFNDFEIPATFAIRGQLTEVNDSILQLLLHSSIEHDIGAHGYYHRVFTNLSRYEAEKELNMISSGMKKFGIVPRSFIFPKNRVAHLDLLEKYGYECYRSRGGFMNDCMYIERYGELYDIHPSLYIDQHTKSVFLKKMLDISTMKKSPFHIWFHLWKFGEKIGLVKKSIDNLFLPLLKLAKIKEKRGVLTFETMSSAAEKVEKFRRNSRKL